MGSEMCIRDRNQLVRSLDSPSFTSSFRDYHWDDMLEIELSQGTVLRKRPDSNTPCNPTVENHDIYVLESIVKDMECIPAYWTQFFKDEMDLPECTSMGRLNELHQTISNYKSLLEFYQSPCVDMYNAVMSNWKPKRQSNESMKFTYKEKYYQEVQYSKDFGFESFLSGIGGFEGIFLGYSMMQFPELIGNIITIKAKVALHI